VRIHNVVVVVVAAAAAIVIFAWFAAITSQVRITTVIGIQVGITSFIFIRRRRHRRRRGSGIRTTWLLARRSATSGDIRIEMFGVGVLHVHIIVARDGGGAVSGRL